MQNNIIQREISLQSHKVNIELKDGIIENEVFKSIKEIVNKTTFALTLL